MANLLVTDIARLATMIPGPYDPIGVIDDAVVLITDGKIAFAGPAAELGPLPNVIPTLSAEGCFVTPGLIDPHTHPIFAGSRAEEFNLRNLGTPYGAIQKRGGGILATVRATTDATDD